MIDTDSEREKIVLHIERQTVVPGVPSLIHITERTFDRWNDRRRCFFALFRHLIVSLARLTIISRPNT